MKSDNDLLKMILITVPAGMIINRIADSDQLETMVVMLIVVSVGWAGRWVGYARASRAWRNGLKNVADDLRQKREMQRH